MQKAECPKHKAEILTKAEGPQPEALFKSRSKIQKGFDF
jgi:hypothetical protein